jgi:Holliday junction DNA helicase RuvB
MARERVISAERQSLDNDAVNFALRPTRLDDITGQRQVVEQIRIAVEAARKRAEPLEHILLDGPPGLGKTTLAHVIAAELNSRPPKITSGPALTKTSDLMSVLTNLERGEVLFIDEVHRLPKIVEEFLYPVMEDFRVDYTIEGGLGGRTISFALQQFTLIGATTRAGLLSAAIRDRFGMRYHFDFYDEADLSTILERSAGLLEISATKEALHAIASRSRGTPRVANRLLRRVRDYAQVRADGELTVDIVHDGLEIQRIDRLGLDDLDRTYLKSLIDIYGGGPAGIEALAATTGQERDTLEDVVEPYLLQLGFVIRTRQGRQATEHAYDHLNVPFKARTPAGDQGDLFS